MVQAIQVQIYIRILLKFMVGRSLERLVCVLQKCFQRRALQRKRPILQLRKNIFMVSYTLNVLQLFPLVSQANILKIITAI
jgi:hypothetical protein